MEQYSYKFKYWRFTDVVFALDQLGCCDDLYVEKVSIKECFKKDEDGLRMKYFLLTFTVRSRFDPEGTGLMKHVKSRMMRD